MIADGWARAKVITKMIGSVTLSFPLLLSVICLSIAQVSVPTYSSVTVDYKIGTSGIVKMVEPVKIRRHLVAYGLYAPVSEDIIQYLAQFDLLVLSSCTNPDVARIKALNPSIIVIAYKDVMAMHKVDDDWGEVDAHEDWFLHDINGNRFQRPPWNWYAMDVGNPGWRMHYANYVKRMLDNYPALDGIFADDTWKIFWYDGWNVPKEQIPADIGPRWYSDMLGMISFVKSTIGNKLLIVNTQDNDNYVDACDGKMNEGFAHPSWWSLDEFHDEWYDWKGKVESLKDISQRGKYYLAHSGTIIPENPTEADLDKVHNMMIYCFASYLLGVNGEKATFGFNTISSKDGSRGYYSEFDVSLGSPVNEYYLIGSVYARDFAYGKVLVNPTTSLYTVYLDSEYKTLDGQIVSSITLAAHTAIILLRM